MNYYTEFVLYIDIVLLVYMFCAKILEDSKKGICPRRHIEQISKVRLVTVVEDDPKAPFSIATTPRCREESYSFPWIAPLYLWSLPYIAEC